MMLDLNNMRKQVKRALCKHDYNTIAMHKWARANLWKCEKCGDLLYQNYNDNVTVSHYNHMINKEDWRPWPSSRDLKGVLDEYCKDYTVS